MAVGERNSSASPSGYVTGLAAPAFIAVSAVFHYLGPAFAVLTLTDIRPAGAPLGFGFAFANCALFMLYVTLGHRVANAGPRDGSRWGGVDQFGVAMLIAAIRDHAAMPVRRGARLRPPRLAAGRCRGRRLLLGHPVRDRPTRHGSAAPGDLRIDAEHLAGLRHGYRSAHPRPTADGP